MVLKKEVFDFPNLKNFFEPKSIAVIGVSRKSVKVGNVILKSILNGKFPGKVYPVNPKSNKILGLRVYKNIAEIKRKVDLGIIAVPAKFVMQVVEECNKKEVKDILIISAGFSEVGNKDLENKLINYLDENNMRCIGVNCLGIYDAYNKLDTLFLPRDRLKRPEAGAISFVCQSGAVGSAILDLAAAEKHRFSKFISYGNATQIDESDLLEYLGNDKKTKVICLYIEGVKNGEKFFRTLKNVSKKKPIIALKGGLTEEGMKATLSHTGTLAGKKEVYFGIFNQTNVIRADSLEEMFNIASLVEKNIIFKNKNTQIITNGGGYGIVSTDNIVDSKNLEMATLSKETCKTLRRAFPKTINIGNPLDLVGDATDKRYEIALKNCMKDKNVGVVLCVALYQTPLLTKNLVNIISRYNSLKKPLIAVSTGGNFTEKLSDKLEERGVPVFDFPKEAVTAIDKLMKYYIKKSNN